MNGSTLSILETAPPALSRALIHELRNHLGQIIGYSELLLEQAQKRGQSSFVPDLQTTHTAGRKMLALLDDHTGSIHAFDTSPTPSSSPRENPVPLEQEGIPGAVPETTATADISSTATLGSVLVVDDIEANRDVLSRRLREQGYTVTAVTRHPELFPLQHDRLSILHGDVYDLTSVEQAIAGQDIFQTKASSHQEFF